MHLTFFYLQIDLFVIMDESSIKRRQSYSSTSSQEETVKRPRIQSSCEDEDSYSSDSSDENRHMEVDNIQTQHFDILQVETLEIEKKFLVNYKNGINISDRLKSSCKILKFTSELGLKEVIHVIYALDCKQYPRLFIFIIETDDKVEQPNMEDLQQVLLKFSKLRPMLLQLTSDSQTDTSFFIKLEDSEHFQKLEINVELFDEIESVADFQSFFSLFISKQLLVNFNRPSMIESFLKVSLIMRFLSALNLGNNFIDLAVSGFKKGSKENFLAVIDAPFDDSGHSIFQNLTKYLTYTYPYADSEQLGLQISIENENWDLINFLVEELGHVLFDVDYGNQLAMTTAAYQKGNIDLLYKLLELCEFPFPLGFKAEHDKFEVIVKERDEFHNAIKQHKSLKEILDLAEKINQKIVYNVNNESALYTALYTRRYDVYCMLMSIGFKGNDAQTEKETFSEKEKRKFEQIRESKQSQNIDAAEIDPQRSARVLAARSTIFNPQKCSHDKPEIDRKKIKDYFMEISKREEVKPIFDVCAQDEGLSIVFDMKSDMVSKK